MWTLLCTVQGEGEDERLVQAAQQEAGKGVERECALLLTRLQLLASHALVSSPCHPSFLQALFCPLTHAKRSCSFVDGQHLAFAACCSRFHSSCLQLLAARYELIFEGSNASQ